MDSLYGGAGRPEQFEMGNPLHSPEQSRRQHAVSSPTMSEQKRASLVLSTPSRVDAVKLLERRRTRTETSQSDTGQIPVRSHTQSEAMVRLGDSLADDEYVRETQSDAAEQRFQSPSVENDFGQPAKASSVPTGGARSHQRLFIHVRHFTRFFNRVPVALKALIWFENGDCYGPVTLTNHKKFQPLNKPMAKYHLTEELQLSYPLRSPIAFIQLRKKIGKVASSSGLDSDIFIHDVYIKPTAEESPDQDILAYFRFTGFIVNTSNILIRNLVHSQPTLKGEPLTAERIMNDARNRKRVLHDRLMPVLEWATVEESRKELYKTRTIVDAVGPGKSSFDFFMDILFKRSIPMFFNIGLSLKLDVARYAGTPGFAKIPPNDQTFSALKFTEFVGSRKEPIEYIKKLTSERRADKVNVSMLDFVPFLESDKTNTSEREIVDVRRVVATYDTDEEFGRAFVESLLCTQLRVVQASAAGAKARPRTSCSCPENDDARQRSATSSTMCFDFLHEHGWKTQVQDPAWLSELMHEAGIADPSKQRLFYVDFSKLVGIPRNEEHGYFSPARGLLRFDESSNRLLPIAVSLFYPEQDAWKTHLPSHASWGVAKMFCKCAAAQDHQIVSHALNTHLVVEPFAIALERRVPLDHILYRVLKTHFRYTVDVNFKARTALINSGGLFDQFVGTGGIHAGHLKYMLKLYKEWTFDSMCFPDEMHARGFTNDPNGPDCELPCYAYAKDAGALWNGIEQYCRGVVEDTYSSDVAFRNDSVARNYFLEVQSEGFPTAPTFIPTTRAELTRVLSGVIFTAAVQHAAVNFPQFSHYAFIANSPLCVVKPAPEPGEASRLIDYLPAAPEASKAIATVWGLSRFVPDDERFLLAPKHHFFNLALWNDPKYLPHCIRLQERLQGLEDAINARPPSAYGTRYLWLQPSLLPTSIAS